MSRASRTTNQQLLKILKNEITQIDQKILFNQIKGITKQSREAEQLQQKLSTDLSLFLKKTVGVNVIDLKSIPELNSYARQLHKYPQPTMILEDNLFSYRIWVQNAPEFHGIKEFRKPVEKQPKEIQAKPEDYQNYEGQH